MTKESINHAVGRIKAARLAILDAADVELPEDIAGLLDDADSALFRALQKVRVIPTIE